MSNDYPGRPDHPDFWLISQALIGQDAQADSGQDTTEILGRVIDPDSVTYAAIQRAGRLKGSYGPAAVAGMWLDGFLAGMTVQQLKNKKGNQ